MLQRLEVLVSTAALGRRKLRQGFGRSRLVGVQVRSLPTARSDPAPAPHKHNAPEQVALNHQGIKTMGVGFGINLPQNQDVLNR